MSQKETTNTFAKGLISDLNAIATPADSLTDAKNATFLTFNGNEMSLQNDMGNTKLIYKYTDLEGGETSEPVALSEGFIPVGVKENGGIIYILSMKPDNEGKCAQVEVGSFPGPEFRPNSKSDPDAQLISTCTLPETYVVNTLEGGENTILKLGTPIQLTEVALEPCDLFEYTLFGVNFDTISTSEERKMYSYKLINMTNNSDITKFCPTFFLNKNISYITFPSGRDDWALSCKIPLADENGTTHNYELMVNAQNDTILTKNGSEPIAMDILFANNVYWYVYNVGSEPRFALYTTSPELEAYWQIPPRKKGARLSVTKLKDQNFYYPNIQNGKMAIQFDLETVDYMNICQADSFYNVIKYAPKLEIEITDSQNIMEQGSDTEEQMNVILAKYNEFRQTNIKLYGRYANQKLSPTCHSAGGPDRVYRYSGLLFELNGEYPKYKCEGYGNTEVTESYVRAPYYNGVDITEPDVRALNLQVSASNYKLKFPFLKVTQPSWIKVNKVEVEYSLYTLDKVFISSNTWSKNITPIAGTDICEFGLNIMLPGDSNSSIPVYAMGMAVTSNDGYDNTGKYPVIIGSRVGNTDAFELGLPLGEINISDAPSKNFILEIKIHPVNTDYNIDLSSLDIVRTIDLTKSLDQFGGINKWLPNDTDKINVSLGNTLIANEAEKKLIHLGDDNISPKDIAKFALEQYQSTSVIGMSNVYRTEVDKKGGVYGRPFAIRRDQGLIAEDRKDEGAGNKAKRYGYRNFSQNFSLDLMGNQTSDIFKPMFSFGCDFAIQRPYIFSRIYNAALEDRCYIAASIQHKGQIKANFQCTDFKDRKLSNSHVQVNNILDVPQNFSLVAPGGKIENINLTAKISKRLYNKQTGDEYYKLPGSFCNSDGVPDGNSQIGCTFNIDSTSDNTSFTNTLTTSTAFSELYWQYTKGRKSPVTLQGTVIQPLASNFKMYTFKRDDLVTKNLDLYYSTVPVINQNNYYEITKDSQYFRARNSPETIFKLSNIDITGKVMIAFYVRSSEIPSGGLKVLIPNTASNLFYAKNASTDESDPAYKTFDPIGQKIIIIQASSQKYTRCALLGSPGTNKSFEFTIDGSFKGVVFNPILYEAAFDDPDENEKCSGFMGQGMKLNYTAPTGKLAGHEVGNEYLPMPFYEINNE